MYDKTKVKVLPEKHGVIHTRLNELAKVKGHPHYYVNLISGRITYRKGKDKIATGLNTIMAAKDFVAAEIKRRDSGQSEEEVKREQEGVIHPMIKSAWDEMIDEKKIGKAKNTGKNYDKSWKHGIKFFWENKTVKDLTNSNLSKYKSAYLEEKPNRVFDQTYVHFGMLVRYAVKKKYIPEMLDIKGRLGDLDATIRSNNQMEEVGRVLTEKESDMILKGVDTYFEKSSTHGVSLLHKQLLYLRTKAAVLMGLKAGMRKMEILSRPWENYDPIKKIMRVWSMKNKEWRDVPLIDVTCETLNELRKHTGGAKWIFPMPSNPARFISSQVFDKVWIQVKDHSGVYGRLRFHDLRHTFATRTAEMGMPPIVACEILDQSYDTYQNTYCNTSTASKSEWMGKLFDSSKNKKKSDKSKKDLRDDQ